SAPLPPLTPFSIRDVGTLARNRHSRVTRSAVPFVVGLDPHPGWGNGRARPHVRLRARVPPSSRHRRSPRRAPRRVCGGERPAEASGPPGSLDPSAVPVTRQWATAGPVHRNCTALATTAAPVTVGGLEDGAGGAGVSRSGTRAAPGTS